MLEKERVRSREHLVKYKVYLKDEDRTEIDGLKAKLPATAAANSSTPAASAEKVELSMDNKIQ